MTLAHIPESDRDKPDPLSDAEFFRAKAGAKQRQKAGQKTTGLKLQEDDVCDVCGKPEDAEAEIDLMQCYVEDGNCVCCHKWFHPHCLGIDGPPDGWWICQACANSQVGQLQLDSLVGSEGLEFVLGDDNNSENEDTTKADNSDEDYKDDPEMDSDDEALDKAANDNSDNNDFPAQKPKPPKRKSASSNNEQLEGRTKKKVPRKAGTRPLNGIQQMDRKTRLGVKALKIPMEELQTLTIPFTRSDEYNRETMERERLVLEPNETHYPWVVHGACCLTNQQPNEDAAKSARFRAEPDLVMWVGSQKAKEWAQEYFNSRGVNVTIYTKHEEYFDSFRSESGKKKKAPPRQKTD